MKTWRHHQFSSNHRDDGFFEKGMATGTFATSVWFTPYHPSPVTAWRSVALVFDLHHGNFVDMLSHRAGTDPIEAPSRLALGAPSSRCLREAIEESD